MDRETLFRLVLGALLCLGVIAAIAERRNYETH